MALLQALISLLTRSAGTVLNTIFGWAVLALFGQTNKTEQTLLSALVGAAAAWPLLLVGVFFPKAFLFIIAFVPLAKSVPGFWLRLLWIALALLVPIVVGVVVAKRAPPDHLPDESGLKKLLRGFPITIGLAGAFLLMLFIAPILKIASLAKRLDVVRVPALVKSGTTDEIFQALAADLAEHGMMVQETPAP